jgi:hypothetical protein
MTFTAYLIRKKIAQSGRVSDKALGVAEDALVGIISSGLLRPRGR